MRARIRPTPASGLAPATRCRLAMAVGTTVALWPGVAPAQPQSIEIVGTRVPADARGPSGGPATAARAGTLGQASALLLAPDEALPITALRLEDLASAVPGMLVEPLNAGLSSAVRLRGFAVARLHRDGLPDIQRLFVRDLATVDQVEVLRGSAGALAGVASPGGVVNFVSKRPEARDTFRLQASAGSGRFGRAVLDASGGLAPGQRDGGPLRYRVVASAQDGRSDVAALPQRHAQASAALEWAHADGWLLADLGTQRSQTPFSFGTVITNGGPAGRAPQPAAVAWDRLYVRDGGGPAMRRHHEARLAGQHQLAPDWTLSARYSQAHVTRDETLVGYWTLLDADTLSSYWTRYHDSYAQRAWRLDLSGQLQLGGLTQRVSLGADRFDMALQFAGTQNIGAATIAVEHPVIADGLHPPGPVTSRYNDERSSEQGVWAAWQAQLPLQLQLDLTLRRQRYAIAATRQPGPRLPVGAATAWPSLLGLSWRPDSRWHAWWTVSRGVEPNRGTRRDGGFLAPQQSRQHEIGAAHTQGAMRTSLAAWSIDLANLAMPDPAERSALMAAGARQAQGLEFTWALTGPTWQLRTHASLMRTRQKVKVSAALGDAFVGVPRAVGGLSASWALPGPWAGAPPRLGVAWTGVGSRPGDAANSVRVAGYGKLDLALRWPAGPGEVLLQVGNATDQRHVQAVTAVDDVFQGRRRWVTAGWQGRW